MTLEYQLFPHFLSLRECKEIIKLTSNKLVRSEVLDDNGSSFVHQARTSEGCVLYSSRHAIVCDIEDRISELVMDCSPDNMESMQVLHYNKGEEYQAHYDWFEEDCPTIGNAGQRKATFMIYLNSVEAGGETSFPKLKKTITPKPGLGLLFWNIDEKGNPNMSSLHAACPVISGEKWISVIWIREKKFFQI